jgi:diguanylate cyclase (GGDEF)-like protein
VVLRTIRFPEASLAAVVLPYAICTLAVAAGIVQHFLYRRKVNGLRRLTQQLESEAAQRLECDVLTGLLSRAVLDKRLDEDAREAGAVAVADLDEFKRLNESLGHLGGDEVLRGIGSLLQHSVRAEDSAYRWGGDEFVMVFRNLDLERARERMKEIEERLHHFHIRNFGEVSIGFSWGIAATGERPLRECLDEADHRMYAHKRNRRTAGW